MKTHFLYNRMHLKHKNTSIFSSLKLIQPLTVDICISHLYLHRAAWANSQRRFLRVGWHKEPSLEAWLEPLTTNINVVETRLQVVPGLGRHAGHGNCPCADHDAQSECVYVARSIYSVPILWETNRVREYVSTESILGLCQTITAILRCIFNSVTNDRPRTHIEKNKIKLLNKSTERIERKEIHRLRTIFLQRCAIGFIQRFTQTVRVNMLKIKCQFKCICIS